MNNLKKERGASRSLLKRF